MPEVKTAKKRNMINVDASVYKHLNSLKEDVFPGRSMASMAVAAISLYCRLQKLGKLHEVSQWGIQDLDGNVYVGGK